MRSTQPASHTNIYFLDGSLPDLEALLAAMPGGALSFILDPVLDGITQMADILADHADLDAIHILSHGAEASVQLGAVTLDVFSMHHYATQLQTIGAALSATGDLLLYGCNVAEGNSGQQFIARLAAATGADVVASIDRTGAVDQGGDWLLESATGSIEATPLDAPAFGAVLAAAVDLADVAAGNGGFVIHGQDAGDGSGSSVASAGDINGDGYDDLIIGADRADAAGNAKSYVGDSYVVFGKASGFAASIDLGDIAAGNGGFVIHGQDPGDFSGASIASAGDINGDGFDDLIISAYRGDAAGNAKLDAGDSYVVFGKASGFGASIDLVAIAAGNGGFVIYGQDAGDRSGVAVASAGDINGDGYDDLIIGAYRGDAAGNAKLDAGDSYVVFGKASGFGASINLADIAAGNGGFVIYGQDANDRSGRSVASAGDINGDGYDDLIIGAWFADAAGNAKGEAGDSYVVFGKLSDFGASIDLVDIAAGNGGFVIHGQDAGDLSGGSVASAGDINGDGYDDLTIGAHWSDAAGNAEPYAGDSYVVFGKANGFAASIDLVDIAAGNGGFVIHGQDVGDGSGVSVASAGDINGDGYDDLIIGAAGGDAAGNAKMDAGDSYVVFGKASGFAASIDLADIAAGNGGFVIRGQDAGDQSGFSVASAGDLNGDGYDDLILGASTGDAAGNAKVRAGDSYVVYGRDLTATVTHAGTVAAELLTGTAGADIMVAGLGNDTVNGGSGNDALRGGAGDDRLIGGAGADRMNGGSGSDTANYAASPSAVTVNLATDINTGGYAAGDHLDYIENLTGSAVGDRLTGNANANILRGGAGVDRLSGGSGADQLEGGSGRDTADYATSTVAVAVNLATDLNSGGAAQGDHLADIENLIGSAFADALTGSTDGNLLAGGAGGDTLAGGAGNDTLDGGAGSDMLLGGRGADTYVVNATGDSITELAGAGDDLVRSSVSRTLGANLERLTLTGTAAIGGTGNGLGNTLIGNAAANTLTGRGGNDGLNGLGGNDSLVGGAGIDTLNGGAGNDTLTGGGGARDHFVFAVPLSATTNLDTVTDFETGVDKLRLDDDTFAALSAASSTTLTAAQFLAGAGVGAANTPDQRILYNSSTGALYYDADGTGAAAAVQFAVLGTTTHPTLVVGDFTIVG